jgi:hypothetical protein
MPDRMTKEHKEALARGRRQARVVRAYLAALKSRRRGRPVTKESLEERLRRLRGLIDEEQDPVRKVELVQKRLDVEARLTEMDDAPDIARLEQDFVAVVKEYSERRNVTYTAWREAGVPARVLREAGVRRTRRPAG